ncbi:MAG: T9SS type A sorting domain-containing protein [Bacteroidales bacterium]|nr:T9SS type A sorting domain-containing protein [Bacteroidales bacterium]MCF8345522.1 T9SS type A sorting domain-containing protein [Bacteroidales bacterium]MCF8377445.1 T9SS type A sorting domain-containing protein [Bacteroidales bacterium]MCF8401558.1 T9SS type A sorting domain-containing protein [Bacteroidales bacterium]
MKTSFFTILLVFMNLFTTCLFSQSRWMNIYYENENAIGNTIANSYDKGMLVVGKHGYNYVNYNWLIKTGINGEILWEKTIGSLSSNIKISDVSYNKNGELFLTGLTGYYSLNDYDPIVLKLNKCGEKEWCRVFIAEDNNFSNSIEITDDGGCVVLLRYMNPDATKDRICLAKLSSNGEQIWNHCYNSPDTSLDSEDAYNLLVCQDGGFLITGRCYYEDMNPPHYWWAKPYFIKTDSLGNFEWETVVHSDTIEPGGAAWSTILSPDSNFFYSFISHYYHNPTQNAPALVKMDMQGQVIGVYDLEEKDDLGKLFQAVFINDSILAGSASWGSEGYSSPQAVLFDTLGNILDSTFLVDNHYLSYVRKTFDNKLLFFTNKYDEELDEFDAYLFKLNTELESDSIYTQQFNYDSLCPYQIESDTIEQDNCGLIVGGEEIFVPKEDGLSGIEVYPNPASSKFIIRCSLFDIQTSTVAIFDLFGRKVKEMKVPKGEGEIIVNTEGWQRGLYLVRVNSGNGFTESTKVILE